MFWPEERPGAKCRNISKAKTVSGRRPRPSQRRQKNQVMRNKSIRCSIKLIQEPDLNHRVQ